MSRTGVDVTVEHGSREGFAARVCRAALHWKDQTLVVANGANEIDLDLFGADMNRAGPVAAFQVKKPEQECCMTYLIYSLRKPPRLLRKITGGSFFSASDRDLDGRIEIWTDDMAAIDGFDGVYAGEVDFPPVYVLRLDRGRLLDTNAEFRSYFDHIIDSVKAEMNPASERAFQQSDGVLRPGSISDPKRLLQLRTTKIQVLELVWAYLYSGREQQAWRRLQELWPEGDVDRIHAAIMRARASGILAQLDRTDNGKGPRRMSTTVFKESDVTTAQPMHLWRPPLLNPSDQQLLNAVMGLDLVIDSAGKVFSVAPSVTEGSPDKALLDAAKYWKFIPARRNGRSVASKLHLIVTVKR